jgi:hypothetical protein
MKTLALCALLSAACLPMQHGGMNMMMGEMGEGGMMHMRPPKWPTVRIDGLDGARVMMQRGVFGDGLDVKAPFQGEFQPTGDSTMAAYPLVIDLDEATARHYGGEHAMRLRGYLTVPSSMRERGILRIVPTVCAVKALVTGDVEKLKVKSDELPTTIESCAQDHERHDECSAKHHHEDKHHGWSMWRRDESATLTLMVGK